MIRASLRRVKPRLLPLALVLLPLLGPAWPARAAEMDLAISRLRMLPQDLGCGADFATGWCPDNLSYKRLVGEFAGTLLPPLDGPAHSGGERGFYVGLDTTVTTIEGHELYWRRGTEGDEVSALSLVNASPSPTLVWNRLRVRKGLPFGFAAGASLGQALDTSLWSFGFSLQLALFEGFRTGAGQAPDVALRGSMETVVGSRYVSANVYAVDLILSKPFVIDRTWKVTPMLALQVALSAVDSGVIDLTPGGTAPAPQWPREDAFRSCRPQPGHQLGDGQRGGNTLACTGDDSDHDNNVIFDPLRQVQWRLLAGVQASVSWLGLDASWALQLGADDLEADGATESAATQVAVNLGAGVGF